MGYGIKVALILGLALLSLGVECKHFGPRRGRGRPFPRAPFPRPPFPPREPVFDVTQFGARGDGLGDGALAFIKAWNAACAVRGPATVLIPFGRFNVGKVVFAGPCAANPIKVLVQGVVLQSTDPSAFSGNEPAMIFTHVSNVLLFGGGVIDGQGASMWPYNNGGDNLLPISIQFSQSQFFTVDNINFVNAKGVHFKVNECENALIQNLHINAPGDSPNTDGIVVSNSKHITVRDSFIATGDDCVALGDTNVDVHVSGITCGPGHGLSIGSLGKRIDEGDVFDISVVNCTLFSTDNGVRIKTYRGSPFLRASKIVFADIMMYSVRNPIIIDQQYNSEKEHAPSRVALSDVHFINIRGTTTSKVPVSLDCSPMFPCAGVELRDINIFTAPESRFRGQLTSFCSNAKFNIFGLFNTPGC